MDEIFPVVAGILMAILVRRVVTPRMQMVALVVLSLVFGFTASFISGELFISWGFLVFDIPLVLLSAVVTIALLAWWQQRSGLRRQGR